MNNPEVCPNCNEALKGYWSSKPNKLLSEDESAFINKILENNSDRYCNACGDKLLEQAKMSYADEKQEKLNFLKRNIQIIPIVSTHLPYGWEYETISIITGQSVTGTGFISEFKSDITDFFGSQSGSFNKKLSSGEELCFSQLRAKAIKLNANAIIATDIDYGDVGAEKGMLMVCATGTAIKIKNIEILGEKSKIIDQLMECQMRLIELEGIKLP